MLRLIGAVAVCLLLASACTAGEDAAVPQATEPPATQAPQDAMSPTDPSTPSLDDFRSSRTMAPVDPDQPVDLGPPDP